MASGFQGSVQAEHDRQRRIESARRFNQQQQQIDFSERQWEEEEQRRRNALAVAQQRYEEGLQYRDTQDELEKQRYGDTRALQAEQDRLALEQRDWDRQSHRQSMIDEIKRQKAIREQAAEKQRREAATEIYKQLSEEVQTERATALAEQDKIETIINESGEEFNEFARLAGKGKLTPELSSNISGGRFAYDPQTGNIIATTPSGVKRTIPKEQWQYGASRFRKQQGDRLTSKIANAETNLKKLYDLFNKAQSKGNDKEDIQKAIDDTKKEIARIQGLQSELYKPVDYGIGALQNTPKGTTVTTGTQEAAAQAAQTGAVLTKEQAVEKIKELRPDLSDEQTNELADDYIKGKNVGQ